MSDRPRSLRSAVVALGCACLLPLVTGPARAQTRSPSGEQVERLVALAEVWGAVRYFHPGLSDGVDWDAALVEVVPDVLAAADAEEYSRAVGTMLASLNDATTRVQRPILTTTTASPPARVRVMDDATLVIRAGDPYRLGDAESVAALNEARVAWPQARAVVVDMRSPSSTEAYARFLVNAHLGPLQRLMSPEELPAPVLRRRVYYGFESTTPFASGQYQTGWFTAARAPIAGHPDATTVPIVFVINANSALISGIVPLQLTGKAQVVLAGAAGGARGDDEFVEVALADGWMAQVRVTESVDAAGRSAALVADVEVPNDAQAPDWERIEPEADAALAAAVRLTHEAGARRPERAVLPTARPLRMDRRYPDMAYPSLGYRVLAAFRIYNVIERFYPYRDLLDTDWSTVLREALPEFVAAQDALAYTLAVARMVERLDDSHAYVGSDVYYGHLGRSSPPLRIRVVEGVPVVADFYDEDAARAAGAKIGDVVVEVDGEPALERLQRYAALSSASTPDNKLEKAALMFLNGTEGSVARLRVRGAADERQLELARGYGFTYNQERSGDAVRMLDGNVGYADLDRLRADGVDEMFERFRDADAIVFDMRGYPLGTAWAIAPRLSARSGVAAARFLTPLVGHPETSPSAQHFIQRIPPRDPDDWVYSRPTVLLIDERTQSQAEHTGLFLKAANGTTFVGSPTAGANGEITVFSVPGGITVGFTGQSVEFPDGTQLQRRGLQPDVEAHPTIEGLRAGRDEVLEAALAFLRGTTEAR